MNSFEKRFKELPDQRLINILQNRSDYSAEAIAAAEKELLARNLSEPDLGEFSIESQKSKRKKQNWFTESRLNKSLSDQSIWAIILTLAGFSLLKGYLVIVAEFNYLKSVFNSHSYTGPYWYDFLPMLLGFTALAASYFLFKKQKIGWILAVVLLVTFMVQTGFEIIDFYYLNNKGGSLEMLLETFNQGYTSGGDLMVQLGLLIVVLMLILRSDIRSYFEVSRQFGLRLFWITLLASTLIKFNISLF